MDTAVNALEYSSFWFQGMHHRDGGLPLVMEQDCTAGRTNPARPGYAGSWRPPFPSSRKPMPVEFLSDERPAATATSPERPPPNHAPGTAISTTANSSILRMLTRGDGSSRSASTLACALALPTQIWRRCGSMLRGVVARRPASTGRTTPVIQRASSLARNTAAQGVLPVSVWKPQRVAFFSRRSFFSEQTGERGRRACGSAATIRRQYGHCVGSRSGSQRWPGT
jgi:hypothetical protein